MENHENKSADNSSFSGEANSDATVNSTLPPVQEEQYIYPEGLMVEEDKKSPLPFILIGILSAFIITALLFIFHPSLNKLIFPPKDNIIVENNSESTGKTNEDNLKISLDLTRINFQINGNRVFPGMTVQDIADNVPESYRLVKSGEEIEVDINYVSSITCKNNTDEEITLDKCTVNSYTALYVDNDEYYINGITPSSTRSDIQRYISDEGISTAEQIFLFDEEHKMSVILILEDDKIMVMSYGYTV